MNVENAQKPQKRLRKITKEYLKNAGLYYLERFESSAQNLRTVLLRKVSRYAFEHEEFNKKQAYDWIEELLNEFQTLGYINDERYANLKIKDYLAAGKSLRYIQNRLRMKGIDEHTVYQLTQEQDYDGQKSALHFAQKKRIGPFRKNKEDREKFKQKDMACLLRAGFDYDDVCNIINKKGLDE